MYTHSRIGSDGRSTQLRIQGLAFWGLIKFSVWGIKKHRSAVVCGAHPLGSASATVALSA